MVDQPQQPAQQPAPQQQAVPAGPQQATPSHAAAAAAHQSAQPQQAAPQQPAQQSHYIGRVVAVSGSHVTAALLAREEMGNGGGAAAGEIVEQTIQIGAMLKIGTPKSVALGIISGLRTTQTGDQAGDQAGGAGRKLVDIELLGESVRSPETGQIMFQRGVSIYPTLGKAVFTTTPQELAYVYSRPAASNLQVGTLFQDDTLPAFVVTDELLGKHFAVLGTTGSGKSCAVALILHAILDQHPNGHVVLLDPHNEYGQAFRDRAELLGPNNLQLPYWLLDFEEICEVLVDRGRSDAESQVEILGRAILSAKRRFVGEGAEIAHITVDTPVPYNLSELIKNLDAAMGQLDKPESSLPYLRLKARLDALRGDRRFDFMFAGLMVNDTLPDVISQILRIPVAGKPITILDLSGVPSEIVDIVVSVMCRIIFDFALWTGTDKSVPVLLVCEEAHRYVPHGEGTGFVPTKKILSRVAKEGRKYGVSLGLVSQRPSELSTSILSQCNTLFALRMSNDRDQDFVRRALPESAQGLLSSLPSLRAQEAIVVGEGVTVPMRLRFSHLHESRRPRSGNACFSEAWQQDVEPSRSVEEVIDRWRKQIR